MEDRPKKHVGWLSRPNLPRRALNCSRFTVELARPVWELGRTSDLGTRRIVPITGGRFEGPWLKGEVLDNGADWQVVTDDGAVIVDTRYLLRLDDGALRSSGRTGTAMGHPRCSPGSRRAVSSTRPTTTSGCR